MNGGWTGARRFFRISLRDWGITLLCLGVASMFSALLMPFSDADSHVPLIFLLAVLLVSRFTDGYLPGLLSSVLAVLAVNYIFTFPYWAFDFSLTGYPLTFLCFFAVSVITCAMTSRIRAGEKARMEVEREKMRGNLLRAISHDLRTPLTSIVGTLNAVTDQESRLSEQDREVLLTDARRDAEWLINMVENLLSITRMEGDTPRLHKEPQVVEEVMGEAAARFRKQYPGLKIAMEVPDEVIFAPMDAMLIEQVIMNLLVNAAVHGQGATRVELTARQEKGKVCISVADNGKGISPEAAPHLFDGQAVGGIYSGGGDSVRTVGIGLSVCRTIVAAHGGAIQARNQPGGGACFSFTLPIEEGAYGTQTEDPDR